MAESWFPIKRYHGRYEVSNLGYVRNAKTQSEVSERKDTTGRRLAQVLPRPGAHAWVPVKELVYESVLGGELRDDESLVHINGNPEDCSWRNLSVDDGEGTPLPRELHRPACKRGHDLERWNLTKDGRCLSCKTARQHLRDDPSLTEEEYARVYASVRPSPEPALHPFFDRRGIGVFDVYTSF